MKTKILTLSITILIIIGSLAVNAIPFNDNDIKDNSKDKLALLSDGDDIDPEDIFDGTRRAVCVGISDYFPPSYGGPDLAYCDDDAKDIKRKLENNGWETKLLTDDRATRKKIENVIEEMAEIATEDDISLFQFSGHGTRIGFVNKEAALCPHDINFADNIIRSSEFNDWIGDIKGEVIIILDSCFSGGMANEIGPEANVSEITNETIGNWTENFVEEFKDGKSNRYVMMACAKHQSSYEIRELQHGLFSYYVIDALSKEGDSNDDKIVTAGEIFDHAKTNIEEHYRLVPQDPRSKGDHDIYVYIPEQDPDDDIERTVTLTIDEIRKLDPIDVDIPLTEEDEGKPEWYYNLSVFSEEKEYVVDNLDNPDGSEYIWNPVKTYVFEVDELDKPEITIKIKLMDEDELGDDIADISNETNTDGDPGYGGTQLEEGRVFEYKYNLSKMDEKIIVSRGDNDESGEDESNLKEDDAQITLTVSDEYEEEEPDLETFGSITGKKVKKESKDHYLGSFTVKNDARADSWSIKKLEWEIVEVPYLNLENWDFTPENGDDFKSLSPKETQTVNVYVTVPDSKEDFNGGNITIKNKHNENDVSKVRISFSVSRSHSKNIIERSMQLIEIMVNTFGLSHSRMIQIIKEFF